MSTGGVVWKAFVRDPRLTVVTAPDRRKSGDKLRSCLCSCLASLSFSGLQFLHQHELGVMLGFVAPF